MMFLAAIEHHARWIGRSVLRALAEKCSGYSDSEAGDYLAQSDDETTCYFCGDVTTNVVNTDCDGDTEFVCERCNDAELGPFNRYSLEELFRLRNEQYDICARCFVMRREHSGFAAYDATRNVCWQFVEPKTSAVPPAAEQGPEAVNAAPSPAPASGSPTVPAGSDAPEAASPAGIPWVDWATPAICEVLAEHVFWFANHNSIDSNAHCLCGARPRGQYEWREHVAPLIAERLNPTQAADARITEALNTFEQHRKSSQ